MLFVTRNFLVDRTAGALELMRQDGVTGLSAWARLLWYLWVRPGMFRKIAGAWFKFFLPGFHPWNEDDRAPAARRTTGERRGDRQRPACARRSATRRPRRASASVALSISSRQPATAASAAPALRCRARS